MDDPLPIAEITLRQYVGEFGWPERVEGGSPRTPR